MPRNSKKTRSLVPIKYTARDFNSIKEELVEYARRYYPDTFQDFNEASFGALMIDTVSYIGDMLSFYMDYQVNESFIDTSIEYNNVLSHARRLGYDFSPSRSAYGVATIYALVPSNTVGTPDDAYMPILKKGSLFTSTAGNEYMLNEDVDFGHQNNEVVVARADEDTGLPTWFAVKAHGQLISGAMSEMSIPIGDFKKFRRVVVDTPNVAEILRVVDSEGHYYHQVDYLSQNVVYKPVKNPNYSGADGEVQHLLKPFVVPRRFVIEQDFTNTTLPDTNDTDTGEEKKEEEETNSVPTTAIIAASVVGAVVLVGGGVAVSIFVTSTNSSGAAGGGGAGAAGGITALSAAAVAATKIATGISRKRVRDTTRTPLLVPTLMRLHPPPSTAHRI